MKQQAACHGLEVSSLTSSITKSQVPGGMSLMECHHTINGNATHAAEVMIRNSKEAPGYDFRNIMQYAGDPISAPGELSTRSTLLFDMVQASQQLSALNYGSCCASEYSSFATVSKSCNAACYSSTSLEETVSILRPLVDEFEDGLIGSRSSSQGILGPLLDREVETAFVTASKMADEDGILHSCRESDEAALTGLVMEKILLDHFQDTSEPSSYPRKIPTSLSTNNPCPTSRGIRELEDRSLVESPRSSSSRIECVMSQEASSTGQSDQLSRMVSSEFTLMRPTFGRPLEITRSGELKTHRKWKQQRPSGALGLYQGPYPIIYSAPSSKEKKSKTRSAMVTDGVERASNRPKRRRTRIISRGDSSAETQRMTHIAVERNRRKQMNDHLSALKALMPSTFVQKTDQASIIGGAVEFVKELEVLLESLLSKQRRRSSVGILGPGWTRLNIHPGPMHCAPDTAATGSAPSVLSTTATSEDPTGRLSCKRTSMSSELFAVLPENSRVTNEVRAECRSAAATVEVKVLGNDAMVNITTHRRAKQLVEVIVALESLDLNILHTSVATSNSTVLYKFNAKVGPQCRMTVNQIAAALDQTFNSIFANHLG